MARCCGVLEAKLRRHRTLLLLVTLAVLCCVATVISLLEDSPTPRMEAAPVEALGVELLITGRVVDGAGAAIFGARVTCGSVAAVADANGLFRCAGLAKGRHKVDARATGFVRGGLAGGGATHALAAVAAEAPLTVLTLRHPGRVIGHVVSDSQPVAAAAVDVHYLSAAGLTGSVGPYRLAGAAHSDPRGRFEAGGLAPGRIQLRARLEDNASALSEPMDLRQGETLDGVLLRLQPGGSLSGTVRSRDGVGLAGRVEVRASAAGMAMAADCDMSGGFAISGIPPGLWQVEVSAPGFRRLRVADVKIVARGAESRAFTLAPVEGALGRVVDEADKPVTSATVLLNVGGQMQRVTVDGQGRFEWHRPGQPLFGATAMAIDAKHAPSELVPIEQGGELVLNLGPGGHIAGRVLDRDAQSVPGALVHLLHRDVEGPDPWGTPRPTPMAVQPDGGFAMGPLRPGRYDLRASLEGHPPGILRGIVVASGATTRVTIRLDAGALLHGRVAATDGASLANARVRLLADDSGPAERSTVTDQDGGWRLAAVPPGVWNLRVQHESYLPELVPSLTVPDRGALRHDVALRSPASAQTVRLANIGIELSEGVDGIVVTEAAGSGAAAGLRVGDRVTSVDFMPTDRAGLQEVTAALGNVAGTMQSIEVQRPGEGPRTIYLGSGLAAP